MMREKHSRPLVRVVAYVAISVFFLLCPSLLRAQTNLAGHWEGTVALPSKSIPVEADFERTDTDWRATILFREMSPPVYAAKSVTLSGSEIWISLDMGFDSVVFDGELSGNTIQGTFTRDNNKSKFKLTRKAGAKAPGDEAQGRPNSAPVPAAEERGTSGPSKTAGSNEASGTSGGGGRTLAASSPRETGVIRDDEGGSRGVIPAQASDGGGADNGLPNFYAVLFAADDYDSPDWPHLNNPIDDAQSIAQELRAFYGFQADVYQNQSFGGIKHILTEDLPKKSFKPNDELLIYFAGHGDFDENDGRGYVIARDSSPPGTDRERQVDFDQLTKWMDRINVAHILLVLDICKGGSIFKEQEARKYSCAGARRSGRRSTTSARREDAQVHDFRRHGLGERRARWARARRLRERLWKFWERLARIPTTWF